jgi:hypothetical protein
MRWTVTLVAEVEPGQRIEHEIASVDRDDRITPATLGLSLAKGKTLLAAIQARLVVDRAARPDIPHFGARVVVTGTWTVSPSRAS